uniref:Shisa N-terminal domain-containing protein n=1 Tax=Sander lucioperca TaxID=283035 RepID=A0A8D0CWX1_SANLU
MLRLFDSVAVTETTPLPATHDTCLGYYDVSGTYDKEFSCNNTDHRFCCGSCFLRFCCADRGKRLEQKSCTNYNTPDWIKTQSPSPGPTGDTYDPELDQTNTTVYITCGVIALVIAIGICVKVAYDKATKPPQEMNVHR